LPHFARWSRGEARLQASHDQLDLLIFAGKRGRVSCVSRNSNSLAESKVGATLRGSRYLTYAVSRMKDVPFALVLCENSAEVGLPDGSRLGWARLGLEHVLTPTSELVFTDIRHCVARVFVSEAARAAIGVNMIRTGSAPCTRATRGHRFLPALSPDAPGRRVPVVGQRSAGAQEAARASLTADSFAAKVYTLSVCISPTPGRSINHEQTLKHHAA